MVVVAYRPPTRTALVGAAAQIREPSSKRKMAAKNPHFAYAGSSESVRSDTEPLVCHSAASSVEQRRDNSTHIKALVDSPVRRLQRWDDARNVRGACKVFGCGGVGGVVNSPVLVRK